MTNDNGINNKTIPFEEWTKDANQVISTARSYVRSIANLSTEDASSLRKAVELANELLVVLDAAPYGEQ